MLVVRCVDWWYFERHWKSNAWWMLKKLQPAEPYIAAVPIQSNDLRSYQIEPCFFNSSVTNGSMEVTNGSIDLYITEDRRYCTNQFNLAEGVTVTWQMWQVVARHIIWPQMQHLATHFRQIRRHGPPKTAFSACQYSWQPCPLCMTEVQKAARQRSPLRVTCQIELISVVPCNTCMSVSACEREQR